MYAMDFAQVGANIREQLKLKGMSQQELADKLNISKQVMNKIVKGNKAINVNELSSIADILDISADELLTVPGTQEEFNHLNFMGEIQDEETLSRVSLIQSAIDEIHMLEELLDE